MYITSAGNNGHYIFDPGSEELDAKKTGSDRWLLVSVIMLMMAGLLAVYSSIAYFAETHLVPASSLVGNHIIKIGISFLVMIIFSKVDYHLFARYSKMALILSWVFLVIVSLYGTEVFGARRSLDVGMFSFQPSSLATVALLIHLCVLITRKQENIKDLKTGFLPLMIWVTVTCGLIGLEDFSSAAVLMGLSLLIMFVGRVSTWHISAIVMVGILGAGALLMQSPERQSRVSNYVEQVVHINSDGLVQEAGYQAQQAQIAVAQGQLFGVGMGKSSQRDFLPAPYNDFIYAIITEEYGLIGAIFILGLYVVILFRGLVFIARRAVDETGVLLAVAATLMVTLYGFVNAAVATGLFPVTGLPMPFVSYGGTSMLFTGMMIGVLLNISKQQRGGAA